MSYDDGLYPSVRTRRSRRRRHGSNWQSVHKSSFSSLESYIFKAMRHNKVVVLVASSTAAATATIDYQELANEDDVVM